MNPHYAAVAERAGHRCEYCHAPEVVFNLPLEVEHVLPSSKQGSNELPNLALACRSCNLFKGSRTFVLDGEREVPLFDPRREEWEQHFSVLATSELLGITATGKVTIALLQLNAASQIEARRLWSRLGLFP